MNPSEQKKELTLKPNLWERMVQWLDKKLKDKASKDSCCNKPGKGKSSCC